MTLETEFENDENDLNSKGSMLDEAANVSDISSNISGIEDVDISSICDEGETNSVAEGEKTGGLMEAKLNRTTKSGGDKEHIQVYLRIRPLKPKETGVPYEVNANTSQLKIESANSITQKQSEFSFSQIYDDGVSQKRLFEATVKPMLEEFVNGLNCLVFTYGVTNSGKTYTLQGIPSDIGILPRALDVIFNSVDKIHKDVNPMPRFFNQFEDVTKAEVDAHDKLKQQLLNSSTQAVKSVLNQTMISGNLDREVSMFCPSVNGAGSCNSTMATTARPSVLEDQSRIVDESRVSIKPEERPTSLNSDSGSFSGYSVWVSFLEIYNEQITDLLTTQDKTSASKATQLKLHDDSNGNVYVGGLKEIKVNSAQEGCQILAAGQRNLKYSTTSLNQRSSRSHCIFNVKLARVGESGVRASLFSFCDLAGAERQSKANTAGTSLKEAANINTSMMELGRCLKQLREKREFVNFRNSKLTYLFQNVLQGSGRAVMIVNIAPCEHVLQETMNTLKFAAVAQKVTTNAVAASEKPKIKAKRKSMSKKAVKSRLSQMSSKTAKRSTLKASLSGKVASKLSLNTTKSASGNLKSSGDKPNDSRRMLNSNSDAVKGVKRLQDLNEEDDENGDDTGMDYASNDDVTNSDDEMESSDEEGSTEDGNVEVTEEITESDEEKIIPFPDYKRLAVKYIHLIDSYKEKKNMLAEKDEKISEMEDEMRAQSNDHMKHLAQVWKHHDKFREAVCPANEATISRLKSELEAETAAHSECKTLLETASTKLDSLKAELETAKHEMSLLDFNRTKCDQMALTNKDWRKEKEDLEKKLFEADEVCAKLSEELEKVRSDRSLTQNELKEMLDSLNVSNLSDIFKYHEDLRAKLKEFELQKEKLTKELEINFDTIADLQKNNTQLTDRISEYDSEKLQSEQKFAELEKELVGKQKQYDYMMDKCAELKQEKEALLSRIAVLSEEKMETDSRLDEFKQPFADTLISKVVELHNSTIDSFQDQLKEFKTINESESKDKLDVLALISEVEKMMVTIGVHVSQLNRRLTVAKTRLSVGVQKTLNGSLSSQELNTTTDLGIVSQDLNALLDMQPKTKLATSDVVLKLQTQLMEKDLELSEVKAEMHERIERNQAVVVRANQIVRKSNVLTTMREREVQVKRTRESELKFDLTKAQSSILQLNSEVTALKASLEKQKSDADKVTQKLNKELKHQKQDADKVSEKLNQELERQKTQHELDKTELERSLNLLRGENESFSSQIHSLQKQNAELISSISRASSVTSLTGKGTLPKSALAGRGSEPSRSPIMNDSSIMPSMDPNIISPICAGAMSSTRLIGQDIKVTRSNEPGAVDSDRGPQPGIEEPLQEEEEEDEDEDEPPVKKSRRATGKQRGRKVAALKKVFEQQQSDNPVANVADSADVPVPKRNTTRRAGKVVKRKSSSGSGTSTRARRGAAIHKKTLPKVPENSILEETEAEESDNELDFENVDPDAMKTPKSSKVSSGTSTTDSLDETKFESGLRVTRSAQKKRLDTSSVSSSIAPSDLSSRSSASKRSISVRQPRTKAFQQSVFINLAPSDSFNMTVDDVAQHNEMISDIVRKAPTRPPRATRRTAAKK
ncbi:uncharacterized protein LOC142345772 isoform X2 [Convolutriloba macropyga]|uniref:uncharacterized protein LOC142345772 isoform X2 n=1 Tax=Convolutriloba macropyga TaxID=536237 RepID=UPI003F525A9B